VATNLAAVQREQALQLLEADAEKIRCLIEVQLENLKMPKCPLYEEVLDTHMFGLSRQIDFAVRLALCLALFYCIRRRASGVMRSIS